MADRTPIPDDIAAQVQFAADRTCCVCRVPGKRYQIHHIDEDPSNHDPQNLAVLCFDCHDLTLLKGGFGRHLNAKQIILYRDEWSETIRKRREAAASSVMPVAPSSPPSVSRAARTVPPSSHPPYVPPTTGLIEYIDTLPELRRLARKAAEPKWAGSTADMLEGSYQVIEAMVTILMTLAKYYPPGHFDDHDARDYFSELVSTRFRWHRDHASTSGEGYSGTIVGPLACSGVMRDLEQMIEDMVMSLTHASITDDTELDVTTWKCRWRADPEEAEPS